MANSRPRVTHFGMAGICSASSTTSWILSKIEAGAQKLFDDDIEVPKVTEATTTGIVMRHITTAVEEQRESGTG